MTTPSAPSFNSTEPRLIAIYGPTASGKSLVAEWLAGELDAQLIAVDACTVYRGFDIGTNKPSQPELYKLLSIKEPHEQYGVGEFIEAIMPLLGEYFARRRNVVLVGGTMYYLRALLDGFTKLYPEPNPELRENLNKIFAEKGIAALQRILYEKDPASVSRIDMQNPVRIIRAIERAESKAQPLSFTLPPFSVLKLGINPNPDRLKSQIERRTKQLLEKGWVEEVRALLDRGIEASSPAFRAIGYDTVAQYVWGNISYEQMEESIITETVRYAKRQRTWMRKERNLQVIEPEDSIDQLSETLKNTIFDLIGHNK